MVPSPKAALGDCALGARVSLAVRHRRPRWAQGGATVARPERAGRLWGPVLARCPRPPPSSRTHPPWQGGPGVAQGPPWGQARPLSASSGRTKVGLVGRELQEAPYARIMMGAIVLQAWPELVPDLRGSGGYPAVTATLYRALRCRASPTPAIGTKIAGPQCAKER